MRSILSTILALLVSVFVSCDTESDTFSYMNYDRSDGKSVEVFGVDDVQAFVGIRTGDDTKFFYQVEGHHHNAATLRFIGLDDTQMEFGNAEIEVFKIPNCNDESILEFISGHIRLSSRKDVLEGTFSGKVLRRWVLVDGEKRFANDTLNVSNGYFKVSVSEEYQQLLKRRF